MAALAALPGGAIAAAESRPGEPVVLTGAQLGALDGAKPERVVAYALRRGDWRRVPVQVDERVMVDFGVNPANNAEAGAEGTVYGTRPTGVAALQYADPGTFVGPDSVPGVDADDEVALMAADAGAEARRRDGSPHRVRASTRETIELRDPLGGKRSFAYLFVASGGAPKPARDYVEYDFALASGDYRSTYRRADGPNPETSSIRTASYRIGFSDRWYFDDLRITAGKGLAPDVLDGFKFGFSPTSCGRSEATFNDGEGAFAANVDGPVRAIRSYVGANSGPLTQRTHLFYDGRHEIATDLRVHQITGALIFHDLSEPGLGATFANSANPGGVPVDGNPDAIDGAVADWRTWTGGFGTLFAADRIESTFAEAFMAQGSEFHLDDSSPGFPQCWGDAFAFGQAGFRTTAQIPNTDPRTPPAETMRTTTTEILAAGRAGAADAARWSRELDAPVRVRVR